MGTRDADFDRQTPRQVVVVATASEWIGEVSKLLQKRWPSIDPARLDDVASDLWSNEHLRSMDAPSAAREWLEPVNLRSPR